RATILVQSGRRCGAHRRNKPRSYTPLARLLQAINRRMRSRSLRITRVWSKVPGAPRTVSANLVGVAGCHIRTQAAERGAVFQALGKTAFVIPEAWTNRAMKRLEAERLHLLHGFIWCPVFLRHPIGCDGHSRAVFAQPAVHKDLFLPIVAD